MESGYFYAQYVTIERNGKQLNARKTTAGGAPVGSSGGSVSTKHLLCMKPCVRFWAWSKEKREEGLQR